MIIINEDGTFIESDSSPIKWDDETLEQYYKRVKENEDGCENGTCNINWD